MFKNRWISFLGVFALFVFLALGTIGGCHDDSGDGDGDGVPPPGDGDGTTTVTIMNNQDESVEVFITFQTISCVTPETWSSFCTETDSLNCNFTLDANSSQNLPLTDTTCNAIFTIAFNVPPSQFCDKTQVEFNIYSNGTDPMDTYDISLVNGFNEPVSITDGTEAGPVDCETGNQNVPGVFPLGCTGCALRISPLPPCDFNPMDNSQCHGGTQFDPDPPCQFTQPSGRSFTVNLNTPTPCPTPTPTTTPIPVPTCPPGTCGGCSSINPFCCPATGGCADSVGGLSGCSGTICTIE